MLAEKTEAGLGLRGSLGVGNHWYLVISGGSDISTKVEAARGVQEDNREGLVEVSQGRLGGVERSLSELRLTFRSSCPDSALPHSPRKDLS